MGKAPQKSKEQVEKQRCNENRLLKLIEPKKQDAKVFQSSPKEIQSSAKEIAAINREITQESEILYQARIIKEKDEQIKQLETDLKLASDCAWRETFEASKLRDQIRKNADTDHANCKRNLETTELHLQKARQERDQANWYVLILAGLHVVVLLTVIVQFAFWMLP